jgi:hypothetical protein
MFGWLVPKFRLGKQYRSTCFFSMASESLKGNGSQTGVWEPAPVGIGMPTCFIIPPPPYSKHHSIPRLARHGSGRWLYICPRCWFRARARARGGVGGVWLGVDCHKYKVIASIAAHRQIYFSGFSGSLSALSRRHTESDFTVAEIIWVISCDSALTRTFMHVQP